MIPVTYEHMEDVVVDVQDHAPTYRYHVRPVHMER
jgi:hypothetical protein